MNLERETKLALMTSSAADKGGHRAKVPINNSFDNCFVMILDKPVWVSQPNHENTLLFVLLISNYFSNESIRFVCCPP